MRRILKKYRPWIPTHKGNFNKDFFPTTALDVISIIITLRKSGLSHSEIVQNIQGNDIVKQNCYSMKKSTDDNDIILYSNDQVLEIIKTLTTTIRQQEGRIRHIEKNLKKKSEYVEKKFNDSNANIDDIAKFVNSYLDDVQSVRSSVDSLESQINRKWWQRVLDFFASPE